MSATAAPVSGSEKLAQALASRHIPKLDALRAISALLVMLYHFGLPLDGSTGVTCFFVISGFLITWLLLAEHERKRSISLKNFYYRRAFRIFPAFYAFWFLVIAGLVAKHSHILWGQALSSFFYVCNYYQGLHHYPSTAFSRTWSLAVEEQFYLLWPLAFAWLIGNPRRLLKVLGGTILGIWILRVVLWAAGVDEAYIYTAFECRADALLIGCALAVSLRHGYLMGFYNALCRHVAGLVLAVAALAASMMIYSLGPDYRNTICFLIEPVLIAIIMVQLLGVNFKPLDLLDARPVRYLGLISYSTYLYHGLLKIPGPMVVQILAAYALASLSYFLIERPFLRLRDTEAAKSIAGLRAAATEPA
jgi:peptidoglycan/LPS O-acetylase OafA/YrhL